MIRISILDDHPLVIDGVKAMLANDPNLQVIHTHTTYRSLTEALALAGNLPDILFLDINLADADGLDECKKLHRQFPSMHIIGLTNLDDTVFVKNMIKNGAKGFLLKNVSNEEILSAIYAVQKGEIYVQKVVQNQLVVEQLGQKTEDNYIPKLTRREKEILELIVQEYTTPEIADTLCIGASTVETHRLNLLQKFGAKNVAGLVREAIKKGLVK